MNKKFRAWKPNKSEMLPGIALTQLLDSGQRMNRHHHGEVALPDELIFLQYVGLKDSHHQEIYEGDILKMSRLFALVRERVAAEAGKLPKASDWEYALCPYDNYSYIPGEDEVVGHNYMWEWVGEVFVRPLHGVALRNCTSSGWELPSEHSSIVIPRQDRMAYPKQIKPRAYRLEVIGNVFENADKLTPVTV